MKSFKEMLSESMSLPSKYAKNVELSARAAHAAKGQIGTLHFAHGADFDVYAADSHDLAYFGKNVVRLKGRTTGKEQAAYVDWAKGTVSFSTGNHGDDKDFEKPAKFKHGNIFKESEENIDLYNQLAEDFEVAMPIDEVDREQLVKGKIYKASSNDMLLKYTGRSRTTGDSFQPIFTVVDDKGVPRLVQGKKFTQSYGDSVLKNLSLVEAQHKLGRDVLNTLKGIKNDLVSGKRTVKKIADECKHFEKQVTDEYAQSVFARLADCKNRKDFETVLNSLSLNESEDLDEAVKSTRDKVIAVLVKQGSNEKDATKIVDKNLADAMKVRPGATPSKLAEVVMSL